MKIVEFLDVSLDLNNDLFKPFLKPNNVIMYVDVKSNHPKKILENIPDSVNKRLSSLSKDENVFHQSVGPYQEALKNAGHDYKLNFKKPNPQANTRSRKRNITWFNPPYCRSVKTNLAKEFFKILDTCFPKENILSKIFNRNTVKVSYSCMPNMGRIISGHNKKILHGQKQPPRCTCTLYECPVNGMCEKSGVIYQCQVKETISGKKESYIGMTERSFKDRITKWRSAFRNQGYHTNSLSTHVWSLKNRNINFELQWRIIAEAHPYDPASKKCSLCTREVYYIMYEREKSTLNKRQEFFNQCPHRQKYLLQNQ